MPSAIIRKMNREKIIIGLCGQPRKTCCTPAAFLIRYTFFLKECNLRGAYPANLPVFFERLAEAKKAARFEPRPITHTTRPGDGTGIPPKICTQAKKFDKELPSKNGW